MEKKNGGPAFPTQKWNQEAAEWNEVSGMTLRDYFAAQALAPMIADGAALNAIRTVTKQSGQDAFLVTAKACYAYADAMIAARGAA